MRVNENDQSDRKSHSVITAILSIKKKKLTIEITKGAELGFEFRAV